MSSPPAPCDQESEAPSARMHNTTETLALPSQEHASASKELLEVTAALEKSSIADAAASSPHYGDVGVTIEAPSPPSTHSSRPISTLMPTGLFIKYFVRVDNGGYVHTYPHRGGPFKSLQEAQEAIDSHHVAQRNNLCTEGLSDEERAVRHALYWYHDGTRKHSAEALASCAARHPTQELLNALLDMHNEDNGLLGDLAYELEDIVSHKSCFDRKGCVYRSYSHFNLTMKTKVADANNNLYFAEVMCMRGDYEVYVLSCISEVKPDEKGECHVCGVYMKHPTHDGYNHGRPKLSRFIRHQSHTVGTDLFEELFAVRDESWLKVEEARVRCMIKEGKEARRNTGDGHGKRDKYVVPARR